MRLPQPGASPLQAFQAWQKRWFFGKSHQTVVFLGRVPRSFAHWRIEKGRRGFLVNAHDGPANVASRQ